MSIRADLRTREYKARNRELEIQLARLQAFYEKDQKAWRKQISSLLNKISLYSQFTDAHGLSNAFSLHQQLYDQRQASQQHLKLLEEFLESQNLSEAFNRAHPE